MRIPASTLTALILLSPLCGCGGARSLARAKAPDSATPTTSATSATSATSRPSSDAAAAKDREAPHEMPTRCATRGDLCTPGSKFVDRLCAGDFPDVTLVMFLKSAPWTHGYLTRKTKAWNASGGASDNDELAFDEEVVILRERSPSSGGIQVSGAGGGYDALRWDGSCVTLTKEELTLKRPPAPKASKVEWHDLDEPTREALRKDDAVTKAYRARRKYCRGATMGIVSLKCVRADTKLSQVIVDFVRNGGTLPAPANVP